MTHSSVCRRPRAADREYAPVLFTFFWLWAFPALKQNPRPPTCIYPCQLLGSYALFVQDLSTLANVRSIQVLQPIDSSVQTQLQDDAYAFEAFAADPVRIEVQVPSESLLSLQMIVLSPQGEKVPEGYSHGGFAAQFTAPVTGTQLMIIKSGETEEPSTGTYTLVQYW